MSFFTVSLMIQGWFVILLVGVAVNLQAARVYGTVSTTQNQPLPFANVYVKGTTIGTTTNEQGVYALELPPGNYEIVFHYIGYQRVVQRVNILDTDVVLHVQLNEEVIELKEVVVSASEDPAYAIMRKAIARREAHYRQIDEYHCTVYIKGLNRIVSAPDKLFGFSLKNLGILDSNNTGIIYLSESVSEFSFRQPDRVKEVMIASKVSGRSDNFSWNSASDFNIIDFYKNSVHIDVISDRVFISPLADNAMFYYRYRLLNTFVEDNRLIYHIEVIPRRKSDPVYSGSIYIVDSLYNLHSLELILTKNSQLKFIDTLKITQTFVPLENDIWMPLSKRFDVKFEVFKIKAEGYYLAIYKNYKLHPRFDKRYFTNESLRIQEESNQKDDIYWEQIRPVPLTPLEEEDYRRKALAEALRQSKAHLDSLDKQANRFVPLQLLLGYSFRKTYHKFSLQTSPIFSLINFNTVEGYNLSCFIDLEKEMLHKKLIRMKPSLRYGIANRLFSATLKADFFYNRKNSGQLGIDFGQYVFQFNRNDPISEPVNTLYTLLAERNYMKLYREQYLNVLHRIEVVNGLMCWVATRYSRRIPLENASVSPWIEKQNVHFTSNVPVNIYLKGEPFPIHDAFLLKIDLRYRPGQRYVTRPDMKIALRSRWPELSISYKKAIPGIFKSQLNYDWIQMKVEDILRLRLLGNTKYLLRGGWFPNIRRIEFPDFKHFNGNQTLIGTHYDEGFQLLDYYTPSTHNWYVEIHTEHHFEGFFFNKVPGVRKLRLQEVLGIHFLYNNHFQDWLEVSAGIENIFRIFRVDVVAGLGQMHSLRYGVRVGALLNPL